MGGMSANDRQVGGDHYKAMAIQPWTYMEAVMSDEAFRGYLQGNVIKYVSRAGRKDDALEDWRKAGHYLEKLIEVLERDDDGKDSSAAAASEENGHAAQSDGGWRPWGVIDNMSVNPRPGGPLDVQFNCGQVIGPVFAYQIRWDAVKSWRPAQ